MQGLHTSVALLNLACNAPDSCLLLVEIASLTLDPQMLDFISKHTPPTQARLVRLTRGVVTDEYVCSSRSCCQQSQIMQNLVWDRYSPQYGNCLKNFAK